jgi:N6-adenosine-specific RNA methylase IME4
VSFTTILMDPPWNEQGGGKIKRGADRHYPLLKTPQILEVVQGCPHWSPADDAHLYVWVTNNYLRDGLWLMERLGFRYVTNVVWVKDRPGLGQYFRGQHELCLFGVRGSGYAAKTATRSLTSALRAPRGRHSAKPPSFYELVEARSRGPYLEIFARNERPGWTSWGNELPTNQEE